MIESTRTIHWIYIGGSPVAPSTEPSKIGRRGHFLDERGPTIHLGFHLVRESGGHLLFYLKFFSSVPMWIDHLGLAHALNAVILPA